MQQSTACLHFAWRTTSLRVGGGGRLGVAACMALSRRWRSTGGRDGLVLSGLAVCNSFGMNACNSLYCWLGAGGREALHIDVTQEHIYTGDKPNLATLG